MAPAESGGASLWADRMESYDSRYSDKDDVAEHVVEVSERTRRLLSDSCIQSLTNESRKHTRNWYNLPKVDATRTLKLDPVIKTLAPQQARSSDKELARIQTFLLDARPRSQPSWKVLTRWQLKMLV